MLINECNALLQMLTFITTYSNEIYNPLRGKNFGHEKSKEEDERNTGY